MGRAQRACPASWIIRPGTIAIVAALCGLVVPVVIGMPYRCRRRGVSSRHSGWPFVGAMRRAEVMNSLTCHLTILWRLPETGRAAVSAIHQNVAPTVIINHQAGTLKLLTRVCLEPICSGEKRAGGITMTPLTSMMMSLMIINCLQQLHT